MDKIKFQQLLRNPNSGVSDDMDQLQQVVRDFPYFHCAHLLLLYGMNSQGSDKFNEQLKQSSICLSSRADLIRAIVNGWPMMQEERHDAAITREIELASGVEAVPLASEISVTEVVGKGLEIECDAIRTSVELNVGVEAEQEEDIVVGEPSTDEGLSFSLEDTQPIEFVEKKEEDGSEKQELFNDLLDFDLNADKVDDTQTEDLIDHFLKVNPRIVPKLDLEDKRGDISIPGLEEDNEIVTETLAGIFEQQGHYQKAIAAYEKLILKFPEKSTYFANRIEDLKKRVK